MQVYPEKTPALVTELVNAESISAFLAKIHEEEEKITALGALTQTAQTTRLPYEVFRGLLQNKKLQLFHYYQHQTPSEDECSVLADIIKYKKVQASNLANFLLRAPLALKGKVEIDYLGDALKLLPLEAFKKLIQDWSLTLREAQNLYNKFNTKTYLKKRNFILEVKPELGDLLEFISSGQTNLPLKELVFLFDQKSVVLNPFHREVLVKELNASIYNGTDHSTCLTSYIAESFIELYLNHGLSVEALLQYTSWNTLKHHLSELLKNGTARAALIKRYMEEIIEQDGINRSWVRDANKCEPYLNASEIKIPGSPKVANKLANNLLSIYGTEPLISTWLLELKPTQVAAPFCLHPALSSNLRFDTITHKLDMLTELPNGLNELRKLDFTTYKNLLIYVRDNCKNIPNYTLQKLIGLGMHIPFKILIQQVPLRTVEHLAPIIYRRYAKSLASKPKYHKYFVFFLASKHLEVSTTLPPDWLQAVQYLKSSPFSSFK